MHPVKTAAAQLSPPDGGFGWVVVFGSLLIHVVADGVTYSYGVLLPVLEDVFHAGESATAAVGSTLFGVTLVVGPIAGALVNRYGCRAVTCVGGVIACVGTVLSMFSPNILAMTLSFGVLTGFGLGLIYLPAIVSVTQWFELKRSFATGIAVCGSGLGTFIFAPIANALIEAYDWTGAMLIIAGILLNCCVFGALFRPVEYNAVAVLEAVHNESLDSPQDQIKELTVLEIRKPKISTASLADKYGTGMLDNRNFSLMSAKSDTHIHVQGQREARLSRLDASRHGSMRLSNSQSRIHARSRLRLTEVGQDGSVTEIAEVGLASPFTRKDALYTGSLTNMALFRQDRQKYKASVLDLSKATAVGAGGEPTSVDADEGDGTIIDKGTWRTKISSVFFEMMDPTLLRDWVFIWFSISNFFTSFAFQVPYIFLPDRAKQLGEDKADAAFLLSIVGIANVVGRIVFGYLSDQPKINRLWLYNAAVTIAGASMCLSVFCHNYVSLACFAAVFGTFIGAFVTLTSVILVDLFGIERLTNAFGILLLFQGIATFIGPPFAGFLKETSETYDSAFIVLGIMMAASGAMLFLIPCVKSLENSWRDGKRTTLTGPQGVVVEKTQNGAAPAEHIRLLERDTSAQRPNLVLPVIQINDRRPSATPSAVLA